MGRAFVFDVPDLSGGLNESAPENIGDNQVARLENWYVTERGIRLREGSEEYAGPYTEDILSVFRYNPDLVEADEQYVLLGCESSIARVDGDAITALQVADGRIYPALSARWWFEQYNNEAFACRRGNGGLKRILGDSVLDAGIAPPGTPPVVTDGGVGKKTGGVYYVAYRYKNKTTGARSNWSPLSLPITLPADRKLSLASITASSSLQVTAREIGCTFPDDPVIRLVGQIDDNTTTTYVDNTLAPDEYGEADVDADGTAITDYRHGLPPDQAWAIAVHKERLFLLNKDGLFWSEPAAMQSFRSGSFLPFQRSTGLLSWEQHGLIIARDKDMKILSGNTPADFDLDTFSSDHGCPAGHSMAVGDGILFWYTGVNIVSTGGGAPAILPGIERIRETLDDIPEASKSLCQGLTVPSRGWYVLTVPRSDSSWTAIVYDYKGNVFQTFPDGPMTVARMLLDNEAEAVFAAFESDFTLYRYLTGTTDDGTAITGTFRTKAYGYDRGIGDKIARHVSVLSNGVAGSVTLRIYYDNVLVSTTTGLRLSSRNGWTRWTVGGIGSPGTLVAAEIEYTGTAQPEIKQMQIDGVNLLRRVVPE